MFKTIIFDRDRKFMFDFWVTMFRILSVRLLFFTTYHSQTNDQSKKINQILEIALRFVISLLNNFANWFDLMLKFQRVFNNSVVNIDYTFNEVVYDFTSTQSNLIFLQQIAKLIIVVDLRVVQRIVRAKINDVITLNQMYFKLKYNRKHQSLYMRIDDWTFLRLHKKYKISTTTRLRKKLSQQYVDSFQITKKIDRLIYRFVISKFWRVHFVFIIIQLKSISSSSTNFFRRSRFTKSNFVFVERDIDRVKFYEMKRLLNKRQTIRRKIKYFVKWKSYESKHDSWKNLSKLSDVMNLIKKYEKVFQQTTFMIRFVVVVVVTQKSFAVADKKSFSIVIRKFFSIIAKTFTTIIFSTIVTSQFFVVVISFKKSIFFTISRKSSAIFFPNVVVVEFSSFDVVVDVMILRRFARLQK